MKFILILFIAFSPLIGFSLERTWGALALSDIHIYSKEKGADGYLPKNFKNLLLTLPPYIKENNIKFIFLLGDSTSGNKEDSYSLPRVQRWWDELYKHFLPLQNLGVQIIPIAGNHDFYTQNHQKGFEYGSNLFLKNIYPYLKFEKTSPLYFSVHFENVDFFFLHLVSYSMDKEQKNWLLNKGKALKENGNEKIAFGHVPLYTRLIKTPFKAFGDGVKETLKEGNISHYICGHEHYFWDEYFDDLRQTILGTSSGTYNFSPHLSHFEKFCSKDLCEFPASFFRIQVNPKDRKQLYSQMFLHLQFSPQKPYELIPLAFYKGEIIPFTLP